MYFNYFIHEKQFFFYNFYRNRKKFGSLSSSRTKFAVKKFVYTSLNNPNFVKKKYREVLENFFFHSNMCLNNVEHIHQNEESVIWKSSESSFGDAAVIAIKNLNKLFISFSPAVEKELDKFKLILINYIYLRSIISYRVSWDEQKSWDIGEWKCIDFCTTGKNTTFVSKTESGFARSG